MNKKLPNFNDFVELIPAEQFPERRQPYLVECSNSLHLAFRDKSGKWKSFSDGRELIDFIQVCAN